MQQAINDLASDPAVAKKVAITATGVTATGTATVPTIDPYAFGEALVSTGMVGLSWTEWIQVVSAVYITALLLKMTYGFLGKIGAIRLAKWLWAKIKP